MEEDQARLRRAPVERFAGTEHIYNLAGSPGSCEQSRIRPRMAIGR